MRSSVTRGPLAVLAAAVLAVGACEDAPSPSPSPSRVGGASSAPFVPRADAGSPPSCARADDCHSRVCLEGRCAVATGSDGVKNGDEIDVDCGGIAGPPCGDGLLCAHPKNCRSGVCVTIDGERRCAPPRPDDGVRNGDESGVDCGGRRAQSCADGEPCVLARDCASRVCHLEKCEPPRLDLVTNGTETDVDCGGDEAPPCALGKRCRVPDDCDTEACAVGRCVPPSPFDRRRNGLETDVDCGGPGNPRCRAEARCSRDDDCESRGCAYDGRCAERRSCVGHFGGDTCGTGEIDDPSRAHESCCATIAVADGARLGKYGVTAGRVRVFLDSVRGDVRGFVSRARTAGAFGADAVLLPEWDRYLPTSFEGDTGPGELADPPLGSSAPFPGVYTSAYRHVAGFVFRDNEQVLTGCTNDGPGTHTVFVPDDVEARLLGDVPHRVARSLVDTKGANCMNYLVAQAFCAWDGGRLQLLAEYEAAWGSRRYPWGDLPYPVGPGSSTYFGNRFPTATDASLRAAGSPFAPSANQSMMLAAFGFSYEHPALVGADYAVFVPAPGRMLGRGPAGHALNDGLMELTGTFREGPLPDPFQSKVEWSPNGSFEGHGVGARFLAHVMNKYGKLGFRCTYPSAAR